MTREDATVDQPRVEVAVFVDLENLRYSMLNLHGLEPNFRTLMDKIRQHGRPSVMRAYADFSEHPEVLRRQLQIVGIEAINVPVKKVTKPGQRHAVERIKNAADMVLALDAILEASDADSAQNSKTFILVTGDADYIKLVTQLRNRFGQRVIVCGVPGSVSSDLIAAANGQDLIDVQKSDPVPDEAVVNAIVTLVKRGPAPLKFWSMKILDEWCQHEKNAIPGTAKQRRDMLRRLLQEGVLLKREIDLQPVLGRRGYANETYLDESKALDSGYLKKEETPQ